MDTEEKEKEIIRDFNWMNQDGSSNRIAFQIFRNLTTGCLYLRCLNRTEGGVDETWKVAEKEFSRLLEAYDSDRVIQYLEQFCDEMWWEHTIGYTQG